jgi:hypothetical protein
MIVAAGVGVHFGNSLLTGIPRNGLVAEYRFDEGNGQNLTDYSGKGNHGQLGSTGGIDSSDPTWITAGLSFDMIDDWINLGNQPTTNIQKEHTIINVFIPLANGKTIISKFNRDTNKRSYMVHVTATGRLGFYLSADGITEKLLSSSITLTLGNPFCTASIYNGAQMQQFINKEKDSQVTNFSESLYQTDQPLMIGTGLSRYNGTIMHQLIYDRAISDSEYMQIYNYIKRVLNKRGVVLP